MSIKGTTKTLYVGKTEINLVTFSGIRVTILYSDMIGIEYSFAVGSKQGFMNFILQQGTKEDFKFSQKANDPIQRTVDFIQIYAPELELKEIFPKGLARTKLCRYCKSEIPYNAIICPYCMKKQSTNRLLLMISVVLFFSIFYVLYSFFSNQVYSENTMPQITESNDSIQQTTAEPIKEESSTEDETNVFSVGDTFESDDLTIMYMDSGEYTSDNMFIEPANGNKFIYIDLSIHNTSDTDLSIGSFSFSCYADDTAAEQPVVTADDAMISIDTVSPDKYIKGKIFFEVPKDASKVEVEYETSFWTQEKIYFIVE